jgi:protein-disulfide isomerase
MQNRLFIVFLALLFGGFVWFVMSKNDTAVTSQSSSTQLGEAYKKGAQDASVTVTQYSDFLCPSCSQVSLGVIPEIMKKYVDTGKVLYEFVPMAFITQGSQLAAEGAFCAAKQNKFWDYHDIAYQTVWTNYFSKGIDPSQVALYSSEGIKQLAKDVGIDQTSFNNCLDNREQRSSVIAITEEAQANGVSGTPYFIVNGTPIKGVPNFEILDAAIKAQL